MSDRIEDGGPAGPVAIAAQMPWRDGDGYSWGGEAVLTIGERAVLFGSGREAFELAKEVALRWNEARASERLTPRSQGLST